MTCVVSHNGYIVTDSAVGAFGPLDVAHMADLNKVHVFDDKFPIWSERLEKEDVCLGWAFSGHRNEASAFIGFMFKDMPLDNIIDYFDELRVMGLLSVNFSLMLIGVHGVFHVECNFIGCKLEYAPHGNYVEFEPPPGLNVMGSGAAALESVIDIAMTFAGYTKVSDFKTSGAKFNAMTVAAACTARDEQCGGYLRLWRVVPDGKGSADLVLYGQRMSRPEDRLLAKDLTEYLPLDFWNEAGDIPYDPITYPDPPPYSKLKKKVQDVEGTAVPENGRRSARRKGSEGSVQLPGDHGQAPAADQQGRSEGDAGRSGQAGKRAGAGAGRSASRGVGRRGKAG